MAAWESKRRERTRENERRITSVTGLLKPEFNV